MGAVRIQPDGSDGVFLVQSSRSDPAMSAQSETIFFSAPSYIADPTSRQAHVRLMKIPALRGLHMTLSHTFKEI